MLKLLVIFYFYCISSEYHLISFPIIVSFKIIITKFSAEPIDPIAIMLLHIGKLLMIILDKKNIIFLFAIYRKFWDYPRTRCYRSVPRLVLSCFLWSQNCYFYMLLKDDVMIPEEPHTTTDKKRERIYYSLMWQKLNAVKNKFISISTKFFSAWNEIN